jgi:hypothetical protein
MQAVNGILDLRQGELATGQSQPEQLNIRQHVVPIGVALGGGVLPEGPATGVFGARRGVDAKAIGGGSEATSEA